LAINYVNQTTYIKLLPEVWATQPEYAPNNATGLQRSSRIIDFDGPGYKYHLPIVGTIAATTVSPQAAGVANTVAGTETEVTASPALTYASVYVLEDIMVMGIDPIRTYTPALATSINQQIDIDGFALAGSLTHSQTDAADFTLPTMQTLVSKILNGGGDKVKLGQLDGWYSPLKWDSMMAIGDLMNAAVGGESDGPSKTGTLGMRFGVNLDFTANVLVSSTLRNIIIARGQSLGLVRKNRPKVEMERSDLVNKIVASMVYKWMVIHAGTGGQHIVTTLT
jgi:hypothetical protein